MNKVIVKMTVALFLFAGVIFGINKAHASSGFSAGIADEPDAEALYAQRCARCHGTDGKAETDMGKRMGARNFTDAKWHKDTKDEDIFSTIKNGNGAMPAFGNRLNDDEIKALVGKVRKFKPAEKQ